MRRLGVKTTTHAGKRRIFFVLDRATRKFQGDIALWMQYIEYARKEKAYKKLSQILTSVLRLHSTKSELWIYAAQYALDTQADMTEARSYMQRGLRFCKTSKILWMEYAKLEMIYIAKIAARRRILGINGKQTDQPRPTAEEDSDADMLALPTVTAEDINPSLQHDDSVDQAALRTLDSTPALTGAIPLAIFDAAMKQFPENDILGESFFNMFAEFEDVPCLNTITQHVVDSLLTQFPTGPGALSCFVRQPVVGISTTAVAYPGALGVSLKRLKSSMPNAKPVWRLAEKVIDWLLPLVEPGEQDPGIHKVLMVTLGGVISEFKGEAILDANMKAEDFIRVVERLHQAGYHGDAQKLIAGGLERWTSNAKLRSLQAVTSKGS